MEGVKTMKKLTALIAAVTLSLSLFVAEVGCDVYQVGPDEITMTAHVTGIDHVDFYAATTKTALKGITHLTVYVDTTGGAANSTVMIVNRMREVKRRGIKITTVVQTAAMSAGALTWLEGDNRVMHSTATLMFHEVGLYEPIKKGPKRGEMKDVTDRECAKDPNVKKDIDGLNDWMYRKLSKILKLPVHKVKEWMNGRDGVFLRAHKALALGLATSVQN
jgi:ATP-dependent protease ClpP protease subunit